VHNDSSTAADNFVSLKAFFSLFPEYKANEFWISGESYAGIYVSFDANHPAQPTTPKNKP
jgi:carboxypeptidase C (cathepsin A)